MSKLAHWDYLQREAVRLKQEQRKHHPLSSEWLSLELQVAGCFMLQAEA